jgi:hypothetical protein
MHPGKPDLLDVLLFIVWLAKQVLPKERPAFVN